MTHPVVQQLNEFKAEFAEKAKKALKDEFKSFFNDYPEIGSILWVQYTPYFNDGDECLFSVKEIEFHNFNEDGSIYTTYECGENCLHHSLLATKLGEWDRQSGSFKNPVQLEPHLEEFVQRMSNLTGLCHGLKDMMKDIFGDHCKVVATRDGFQVEEFNHD